MDRGHGWGLIAFLFVSLAVITWFVMVNKKSEDNTYERGSIDASKSVNVYPLGFAPGCEFIRADGKPIRPPPPSKYKK